MTASEKARLQRSSVILEEFRLLLPLTGGLPFSETAQALILNLCTAAGSCFKSRNK